MKAKYDPRGLHWHIGPLGLPFHPRAGFAIGGEEKIMGVTNWFLGRAARK